MNTQSVNTSLYQKGISPWREFMENIGIVLLDMPEKCYLMNFMRKM